MRHHSPFYLVKFATMLVLSSVLFGFAVPGSAAEAKQKFRVAWTIYVGWMPWDYAEEPAS